MLKVPRSNKSDIKYPGLVEIPTENSCPEYAVFKYLPHKS